jgi:hypothetical protein
MYNLAAAVCSQQYLFSACYFIQSRFLNALPASQHAVWHDMACNEHRTSAFDKTRDCCQFVACPTAVDTNTPVLLPGSLLPLPTVDARQHSHRRLLLPELLQLLRRRPAASVGPVGPYLLPPHWMLRWLCPAHGTAPQTPAGHIHEHARCSN